MPVWFIISLIFLAIAVIAAVAIPLTPRENYEGGHPRMLVGVAAGIFLALGILTTVVSSANQVPIRNVGVVTSFGKPTGDVTGSGLKWVAPWNKVGEWEVSRQKYDHIGKNCVKVRTGTLADACVELLIEWQVKDEAAPKQFLDYKGEFESFKGQRVGVQLDSAVNDAFAKYNPLQNIDATTGNLNVDLKPFADGPESIKEFAQKRLGNDIEVLSVTIVRVNHDDKTEGNIKAFQDKLAQTRNLTQDQKNAEIQKKVTETNATVDKVTRCLEISEKTGTAPGLCLNPGIVMGSK